MKKIFLIPTAIALLASSCGSSSGEIGESWAQKYKDEMIQYIGEVLPYVPFNSDTIYSGWKEDENCYYIGDYNDNDLLADYGTKLTKNGNWTATTDAQSNICYTKESSVGTLWLYAKWYEADTDAAAGNEIQVYVDGGSVIPGEEPVDGTFTVDLADYLKDGDTFDGSTLSSFTATPGITFTATKGSNTSNAPKYYSNGASLRLYTGNTYTISANNITKIEFNLVFDDNGKAGSKMDIVSGGGSYSYDSSSKVGTWTGEAGSIQFKVPSGQKQTRIASITVTGSFSGEGGSPVDPGEDERTTLSVAKDIAFNLFGPDVNYDTDVELYEGNYYVTTLSELETAQATVEEGKKYLPDYVELDTDTVEDTEEAGFWYAIYLDVDFDNNGIVVQINSYVDDDNGLLLEYLIYDYWNSL